MSRRISKECTRKEMNIPPFVGGIDPQLDQAGWYLHDYAHVRIYVQLGPQKEFIPFAALPGCSATGVVARVESLQGRKSDAGRRVEGLFEGLLNQSFRP